MQIIVCKRVLLLLSKSNEATKPKPGLTVATGGKKWLRKAVRIMKIAAILLLATCLQVTAAGHAQKISLSEKDAPIEKIFKKIERMTDYKFLYMSELLDKANKVTISVKDASVEQVLDLCLKEQVLEYEINENTIIIRPRSDLNKATPEKLAFLDAIEVRGIITDENGAPAQGVNVVVKGTSKGTTTNLKGEFVLSGVDENAVLLITSVGYDRQEVLVKNKTFITTQLKVAVGNLDELQVIAYGTTSKRFSTGNVTTIKASDIEKQPVNNPLLALQGRVPGLVVTQNSGVPGAGITVRIQGQNSIFNGNDPLYVIDGIPYFSQLSRASDADRVMGSSSGTGMVALGGNPLSYLNPNDIESIEVLKDADATAIYGSRAANGAILISTKKGKSGATKFDLNFYQGIGKVTRLLKVLNRRQYLDMRYESLKNDGVALGSLTPGARTYDLTVWDTTRETNWQKEFIGGAAKYTNLSASISGGNSTLQYLLGATYNKETTVFPGDFSDQKGSVHFNINNTSLNQRFRLQFLGNYMFDDNSLPGIDLTEKANLLEPVAPPLYNSEGSLNWASAPNGTETWENPLVPIYYRKYKNKTSNLIGSLQIGYTIIKGLEFKTSVGYTNLITNDFTSTPLNAIKPNDRTSNPRSATYGNRSMRSWIFEPQLTYKTSIGQGRLDILVGGTIQQNKNNSGSLDGSDYSSDQVLEDIKAAGKITVGNSVISEYKYSAAFGRITYNWAEKYILNLNGRRDGSSRFGGNNRFHSFGSVGVAWIFSEEKFLKNNDRFLSFGKFRGSFGTTGNDQIGDYQFLSLYDFTNNGVAYQNVIGLTPSNLPNPNLQWEETKKIQFGIDIGLINNRILLGATYARNLSSNQLLSYVLPTFTGNNSIVTNFPGKVSNETWELVISTVNIRTKYLKWTTNLNFSIPKNEVEDFPNLEKSTYANILMIGQPLFPIKVYRFAGVDAATGLYQVYDKDGKPTLTPKALTDKTVITNKNPKFYGGFQNSFTFKGIQLDFLFQFLKQKGFNNFYNNGTSIVQPGLFITSSSNQPVSVLDRWQKPGDIKPIQKFSARPLGPAYNGMNIAKASDLGLTDASFIRLKNVSLSWRVPLAWTQKAHLRELRVYANAQNLLTITNYDGADPENQGYTTLPPLRVLTIGIKCGL